MQGGRRRCRKTHHILYLRLRGEVRWCKMRHHILSPPPPCYLLKKWFLHVLWPGICSWRSRSCEKQHHVLGMLLQWRMRHEGQHHILGPRMWKMRWEKILLAIIREMRWVYPFKLNNWPHMLISVDRCLLPIHMMDFSASNNIIVDAISPAEAIWWHRGGQIAAWFGDQRGPVPDKDNL